MRYCVIASSNGSSLKAYLRISKLNHEILLISDRSENLKDLSKLNNIKYYKINYTSKDAFSKKAKQKIDEFGNVEFVLLFFTRIIGREIYQNYNTFNLHTSLLPSFPGLNSINKSFNSKVKVFGSTLHLVDSSVDGGEILAQVFLPNNDFSIIQLKKLSFINNVILILILEEMVNLFDLNYSKHRIHAGISNSVSPSLINKEYIHSVKKLINTNFNSNESKSLCNYAANLYALDRLF